MILPMNIARKIREGSVVVLCPRCQWSNSYGLPHSQNFLDGILTQRCPNCGGFGLDRVEPGGDAPVGAS